MYISDYDNNRILGFNSVPAVNNAVADFVLGQLDFTTTTPGVTSTVFSGPQTVAISGGKMLAVSFNNRRVLIWNTVPTSGGVAPDVVVGQVDFTSSAAGCTGTNLSDPQTLWAVDGKLIVTDSGNHRLLVWNTFPTSSVSPAKVVLGQGDFILKTENDDNQDNVADASPSARTLRGPSGVNQVGTQLFVSNLNNSRILIYDSQ